MIESLESVGCVRMEGYAVFDGTVEIFESVDGRFVVLFAWFRTVRCKKGKDRCNIRTAA